jgi:hypothetical protein
MENEIIDSKKSDKSSGQQCRVSEGDFDRRAWSIGEIKKLEIAIHSYPSKKSLGRLSTFAS